MRAAVVYGPNALEVGTVPEPVVGEYDALVRIIACGVCTGTDLHILQGIMPRMPAYPLILGHESIGRVLEVGPKVRYLRPGDLVLRPMAVRPGEVLGRFNSMYGGFAELGVAVDARAIVEDTPPDHPPRLPPFAAVQKVVPAGFDPIDAGMFITFRETLSWMYDLGPVARRSLVVLGTGPVGLCFVRIAKFLGADPVIAVGRREEPLELARQLGADAGVNTAREDLVAGIRALTGGRGADCIVEAVGSKGLLMQAMGALADQGQLAVYGVPPTTETPSQWAGVAADPRVRHPRTSEEAVHDLALNLVRLGFIDLRSFVTHVLPLSRIGEALRLVAEKQTLKPAITIGDG
ncbi:MAG: zinc-binding dehydrogenase [Chloroflexi bacterium]|nr:zinc-binding dehydrogenase [Chloroflexota bacterium]